MNYPREGVLIRASIRMLHAKGYVRFTIDDVYVIYSELSPRYNMLSRKEVASYLSDNTNGLGIIADGYQPVDVNPVSLSRKYRSYTWIRENLNRNRHTTSK